MWMDCYNVPTLRTQEEAALSTVRIGHIGKRTWGEAIIVSKQRRNQAICER